MKSLFLAAIIAACVSPAFAQDAQVSGIVRSGDIPVGPAEVRLFKAGAQKGAGATELGSAIANDDGKFTIDYDAPDEGVLYLVSYGPAPDIRLATVIGPAPYTSSVIINERTTVATAYAMAQFIDGDQIGGHDIGLTNAARMLRNLVNINTGMVGNVLNNAVNGTETSTLPTFNSLANILASCVNKQIDCLALFEISMPPDGPFPTNTLQAMVNIAHHAWQNPIELFVLSLFNDLYQPSLDLPPVSWTLAIKFIGNGKEFDGPGAIAFDGQGNAWINNNYQFKEDHTLPTCGGELLHKLAPDGSLIEGAPYTGGGLDGAGWGITIAPDGDIWVGNFGFFGSTCPPEDQPLANSVSRFLPTGEPVTGPDGYTQGNISSPQATVAGPDGSIWIANACGDSVTKYNQGDPNDNWNTIIGADSRPFGIAVTDDNRAWVTNNSKDGLVLVNSDGTIAYNMQSPDVDIIAPMGVALDSHSNVWVSNSGVVHVPCPGEPIDVDIFPNIELASISLFDPEGNQLGHFQGGGIWIPWGIAVDGNNDVWLANFGGFRVSHFAGVDNATHEVGKPIAPNGYYSDALQRITGVSIDQSGNVWLANNWLIDAVQTNPGGDGVVVFIGLAAPVATPLIGLPEEPGFCTADINEDGILNVLDFVAFQLAWQAQEPIADCDNNGEYDVLDFVCYQQLFQAGCP